MKGSGPTRPSCSSVAMTHDFEAIYRDHVQRVARWAGWLLRSPADVEDVVQDVFVTAHRLLPGFRGEAQISTWLFRLTANAVRHHERRARRRRWLRLGASMLATGEPEPPTPDQLLESTRDLRALRDALDSLPDKYRTVLILARLEGLPGEQIAEITETKVATVWVRLHRARAALAERFAKRREQPEASLPTFPAHARQPGGPT
jgi:RNA polymerase sigma-70 factor, ECF subfamily